MDLDDKDVESENDHVVVFRGGLDKMIDGGFEGGKRRVAAHQLPHHGRLLFAGHDGRVLEAREGWEREIIGQLGQCDR